MLCDNRNVIHMVKNLIYHKRIKHIKVDYHFVIATFIKCEIVTPYVKSIEQFRDMFTKAMSKSIFP